MTRGSLMIEAPLADDQPQPVRAPGDPDRSDLVNRRLGRRTFVNGAAAVIAAIAGLGRAAGTAARPIARQSPGGDAATQASPAPAGTSVRLSYVSGSTAKIEQIIGDYDRQLQQPTLNQTQSRYGLVGTDLGNSFEHEGKVYFLFGDNAAPGARDPLGYSESADPDGPLRLDFLSARPGSFIPVGAPGVRMGPFEVPVAGLSLDGTMYVVVSTNHSADRSTDTSVLLRFDPRARTFSVVREISRLPSGHFIKMTLRLVPEGLAGLPSAAPHVLMFASGEYRRSNAYLAAVPAQSFASGENARYLAGLDGAVPHWSERQEDAAPIVVHPTIGDLSVSFVPQPGLWVMNYDSREPRGVLLRYAAQPWGPWSEPSIIFNLERDHALGSFIHDPRLRPDDGLAGPVAGPQDPAQVAGGGYAPYIIERFTRVQDNMLTLQYLLSTWNPYTVVRLRSTLAIATADT